MNLRYCIIALQLCFTTYAIKTSQNKVKGQKHLSGQASVKPPISKKEFAALKQEMFADKPHRIEGLEDTNFDIDYEVFIKKLQKHYVPDPNIIQRTYERAYGFYLYDISYEMVKKMSVTCIKDLDLVRKISCFPRSWKIADIVSQLLYAYDHAESCEENMNFVVIGPVFGTGGFRLKMVFDKQTGKVISFYPEKESLIIPATVTFRASERQCQITSNGNKHVQPAVSMSSSSSSSARSASVGSDIRKPREVAQTAVLGLLSGGVALPHVATAPLTYIEENDSDKAALLAQAPTSVSSTASLSDSAQAADHSSIEMGKLLKNDVVVSVQRDGINSSGVTTDHSERENMSFCERLCAWLFCCSICSKAQ